MCSILKYKQKVENQQTTMKQNKTNGEKKPMRKTCKHIKLQKENVANILREIRKDRVKHMPYKEILREF